MFIKLTVAMISFKDLRNSLKGVLSRLLTGDFIQPYFVKTYSGLSAINPLVKQDLSFFLRMYIFSACY